MGCDIHWYSESKKDGVWIADTASSFGESDFDYTSMDEFPDGGRDYCFFGLLNNVRSDWDWAFGDTDCIPEDASKEVNALYTLMAQDAHSAGSVSISEIQEKLLEINRLRAEQLIHPTNDARVLEHHSTRLIGMLKHMAEIGSAEDQRVIFWFDN